MHDDPKNSKPYTGRYRMYPQTPGQTLGPFFHQGLLRRRGGFHVDALCSAEHDIFGQRVATGEDAGRPLHLEGRVLDGRGQPVADALLEVWQADSEGHFAGAPGGYPVSTKPGFVGFGRAATDSSGCYRIETLMPGRARGPEGRLQASHLCVIVGARGMTRHAFTRVYFDGGEGLSEDPILSLVPPERRHTLIAQSTAADGSSFRWDVRLQGVDETVFFDV